VFVLSNTEIRQIFFYDRPFLLSISVSVLSFSSFALFLFSVPFNRLSWLASAFERILNIAYRVMSYRSAGTELWSMDNDSLSISMLLLISQMSSVMCR